MKEWVEKHKTDIQNAALVGGLVLCCVGSYVWGIYIGKTVTTLRINTALNKAYATGLLKG